MDKPTEIELHGFPVEILTMAYVRQVWIEDTLEWALFNSDGGIMYHTANRSAVFFFAADIGFPIMRLQ